MAYKLKFNDYELKQFDLIKRLETREWSMIIYSKMKKYSNPETGFVCRTITDIHYLINRTREVNRSCMYRYINTLLEVNLLVKGKFQGEYFIVDIINNNKPNNERNSKKQDENIENQQLQMVLENHNNEVLIKNNTNTLINEIKKEIVPVVEVIKTTKDLLKTLNLKKSSRDFIEKLIKNRLVDYNIQVNRAGLENYIKAMIREKLTFLCGFSNNRTDKSVIRALECLA